MKKEKIPVRLGVVGLGRAGWGMQMKELSKKKDLFQVVAACDVIPERVKRAEDELGCKGYATIEELLADPNVELVDIATRNCDHFAHAKLALEAGKNVLLEKPMTLNVEQAKELISMANKEGKPRLRACLHRYPEAGGFRRSGRYLRGEHFPEGLSAP